MKIKTHADIIEKLFNDMDKEKKGEVNAGVFMVSLKDLVDEGGLSDSFAPLAEEFSSKEDKILTKLKKLKQRAAFVEDKESLEDLNWIITSMNEGNIYDLEFDSLISRQSSKGTELEDGIDLLRQFSMIHQNKENEKDLKTVTLKHQKTSTLKFIKNLSGHFRK